MQLGVSDCDTVYITNVVSVEQHVFTACRGTCAWCCTGGTRTSRSCSEAHPRRGPTTPVRRTISTPSQHPTSLLSVSLHLLFFISLRSTINTYTHDHRLSINRPTNRGKDKSSSDGHYQCETEMDDHLLECE
jgi:hypothetical protein